MRKFSIVIAVAVAALVAVDAAAQTTAAPPPAPSRFTASINVGFQPSSQDISQTSEFDLYDERARIEFVQSDISGGPLFDVGGNARLWHVLGHAVGAGLSYTRTQSSGNGTINGSIPHPLIFENPRTLTASVSDMKHKEQAVHLSAVWFVPFTTKVDFSFSVGPSFYNIAQDLVSNVGFSETPPFTSVTVDDVSRTTVKKNAVGFNIGADATYAITQMFGAGLALRYTRASTDMQLDANSGSAEVKAGGFQLLLGGRARF
jgi:opacity protein-like surface antigen